MPTGGVLKSNWISYNLVTAMSRLSVAPDESVTVTMAATGGSPDVHGRGLQAVGGRARKADGEDLGSDDEGGGR